MCIVISLLPYRKSFHNFKIHKTLHTVSSLPLYAKVTQCLFRRSHCIVELIYMLISESSVHRCHHFVHVTASWIHVPPVDRARLRGRAIRRAPTRQSSQLNNTESSFSGAYQCRQCDRTGTDGSWKWRIVGVEVSGQITPVSAEENRVKANITEIETFLDMEIRNVKPEIMCLTSGALSTSSRNEYENHITWNLTFLVYGVLCIFTKLHRALLLCIELHILFCVICMKSW